MTYIPPEEKKRGGTSTIGDVIYVILFYLVEGLFILLGIPLLVLAIGIVPVAMYVIITQGRYAQWPLYVAGVVVILLQILGIQYFLRKYVLEPNNKTFGEWLRWKFSPTEISRRRAERRAKSKKMEEWYDGFDRVKDQKEKLKEEQSEELYKELFPEISKTHLEGSKTKESQIFTLGEPQETEILSGEEPIETTIMSSSKTEFTISESKTKEEESEDEEENTEIEIEW
ncbi:MAG: hypothetical protein FK730_00470 [Asgard group archaeon]|nr:hypothetical protein [Asgard group archaeon]